MSWIQTFTGRAFFPLEPRPEDVDIKDIAHALARNCRYTGHVRAPLYSVAQHSVLVSQVVSEGTKNVVEAMAGLLHDASEAYLSDIASPVKNDPRFAFYRDVEAKLEQAIAQRFGLPWPHPYSVKEADELLLVTECRDLMSPLHPDWRRDLHPDNHPTLPAPIVTIGAEAAEILFMERYDMLSFLLSKE